jgi:hypothetical protein
VGDALEDWLAHGVDGLSARTVTLYRGTIVKALNEELGGVRVPKKGGRLAVPCGCASPGIAVPKLRHLGAGPGRRQSESSDSWRAAIRDPIIRP